jgi:Auxiliary Activity family 9 (formerly GH61)
MANLNTGSLAGPQFYPYCFNVDVINGGSTEPEGVQFPGAYKLSDYGIAFQPWMSYKDEVPGITVNAKYVCHMYKYARVVIRLTIDHRYHQAHQSTRVNSMFQPVQHQLSRRLVTTPVRAKLSMMRSLKSWKSPVAD